VTLRQVIIPQALRVIIPPLTSQYLNIAKTRLWRPRLVIGYGVAVRRNGVEPDRPGHRNDRITMSVSDYQSVDFVAYEYL
jgi:ABC-type amino acid transport system permease subunit